MPLQETDMLDSENAEVYFSRGVQHMENGEYTKAEVCFLRTRSLAPDSLETVLNLGYSLDMQGRSAEAVACYESVLSISPNNAKARYNRAMHLLRAGRLTEGFADYEARFAAIKDTDSRIYSQPRWDGSPLNGRSILVYCEQGLGDAIQFCRYIPYVAKQGGRVVMEVQPPLVSLLSGLDGVESVAVKSEIPPHTDVHIPLLSLPHIFRTTLETIPDQIPRIIPSDDRISIWKERVKSDAGVTKIGLVWAGKLHPYPNRSCPPEYLEPLLSMPGCRFYSLQVGEHDRFPLTQAFSDGIVDLTDDVCDFSDTAALIHTLDLVITIDTAVAHLAGAMGKPVWIMLPHATDWRWMLDRPDSPWYPTARLFRQQCPGDWQSVVTEMVQLLKRQLSPKERESAKSADFFEASFQQALTLIDTAEPAAAIRILNNLLAELPDDPAILFNVARAYDMAERAVEAEHAYRLALSNDPGSPAIWFGLGGILLKQKTYQEAEHCLRKAHELKPESIDILLALGAALIQLGNHQEALDCCHKVLAITPDSAEATYNMAFLQLRTGDYRSGFANFEARFGLKNPWADTRVYRQPRWDGSPLNGRSILVYGEEGMGDVIQFSRYIPLLAERGGVVVFEVDPPLLPLFEGFPGVARLVPKSATPPVTDVYIETLSLPYLFGTTYETVPNRIPYLVPDDAKVMCWRQVLAEDTNQRVGLVWRGNPLNPRDKLRSCHLSDFSPLAALPDISFYSLQVGPGSEEAASPPEGMMLVDLSGNLKDFTETAALIANLDIVICVDTAVAHLAGAMGKPVWVILPQDLDWRWPQGRNDTPWYPGMRLFCQEGQHSWIVVLQQVYCALELWLAEKASFYRQNDIEAAYERGAQLKEAGDLAGAERCFRQIVEQHPDLPDPQHSLGVVLQMQGRPKEAIEHYKAAIALDPCFVQALYNLANSLVQSGMSHEGMEYAHALLLLNPADADAHWLLGMLLLLHGDYQEGWKEYEWRWLAKNFLARIPDFDNPFWYGSSLVGKTLLIQMEQGRGDMIQFIRFAPMAAAMGGRVVVSAVPELVSLLSTADGVSQTVGQNEPLPVFDFYIPAMSLPLVLGTTLETIPSQVPYLHPDPLRVEALRREMPADELFRVGLAWYGSSGNKDNENRSCPLAAFEPLFDLKGVVFYTLQIGDGSDQLETLPVTMEMVDITHHIHDYADSAALIENLDLVISVCTSVAHLAGAINKPVWTLLHFASDWRWLLERDDSPWYPSMRLFRQTAPGDWTGVIARVRDDLAQMLESPGFHNQRGVTLMLKGNLVGAERAFSHTIALDQMSAEAYCNRGAALHALDRFDEALICYQTALVRQPDFQQALFNMGNTYLSLNRPEDAQACYEREIELNPNFVAAHLCLGEVGKRLQNFTLARTAFEQAATLDPYSAEAFLGVAEIMQAEEHFEDAIVNYRRSLELKPESTLALNMMGTVYQSIERLDEAETCYRQALALMPDKPTVLNNLGTVLNSQGRLGEAVTVYRQLLEIDGDYAEGHWNLSLALLAMGAYSNGWREYEWRFKKVPPVPSREYLHPWDGGPLNGETILLHSEQGLGDTLQFVRYLPLVAKRGGRVILECQLPSLKRIMSTLEGVAHVFATGEPVPRFDCHLSLLSLPLLFNTTLETIPQKIPYLFAKPQDVEDWNRRFSCSESFRVGLVWFGRQGQLLNRKRSCPLEFFTPLGMVPGVEFFSLQVGDGAEQLIKHNPGFDIIDLTAHITDFADTAAFMANLDLVITIDTAVAHLAGAIGVKTWVLLPFSADWRWLLQRDDSPWYPSMRLFRQASPGDWKGVFDRLCAELELLLGSADLLNQLGINLMESGFAGRAASLFSKAITLKPDNGEFRCNRGVALDALRDYDAAIACYREVLCGMPESINALFNMGNTYRSLNKPEEARACYERVIKLNPDFVRAYIGLGEVGKNTGNYEPARIAFERAASIDPECAEAFQGIAEIFQAEERYEDAIVAYSRALDLKPGNPAVLNMMGAAYHSIDQLNQAEQCYRQVLYIMPDQPSVLNNLAVVLNAEGRLEEAVEVYRHLLDLDPEYADGHWNLAVALLAKGSYSEGWREFEWRFRKVNPVPSRLFSQPLWDGSRLSGKTILLHAEQGFGDTIQFARYAPLVAQRGGDVIIECQIPALREVLLSLEGVSQVVVAGDILPSFDFHLPLMSLPLVFDTTLESIPCQIPYLAADPQKVEKWRRRVGASSRFKVGLVWYAKQSQVLNRKRSCPLSFFSPLWNVEGVEFYTLQIGVGTEQLQDFSASYQIIDLTRDITSFADTAAFIRNLDLVISIDTVVAHLAGALGAQTWVVLPYVAEWRWLCQREDSPWYPTLRLFRQPSPGDWLSLMNNVAAVLDISVRDRDGNRNVPSNPARLRVGLAWAGRRSHPLDWRRSCPFSVLAPLFNLPYISFVMLQPDQFDDDVPRNTRLIDLTEHIHDFEDTAALMANLDLIISIDTATAHLAAATGRPTWLLLSHAAEWRWLTDRVDSPWYPTMRLFRQRDHGDWERLIQEVAHRLADLSNGQLNWNEQVLAECSRSGHSPEQQMLERQLKDHQNCVALNGSSPDAHLNLGASLALCGRYGEAEASFRRVLELDPEHVAGHLNLAYSLLTRGDYLEGWRHFEWRLRYIDADFIPPWPMLQPDDLLFRQNGTSLLVHCEQGYGDTIQFSRFLPLLAESGYQVIVSCQPPVASLVASIPGVSRVIPHGDLLPLCDRQILLLSLPWLFSVTRELLPLTIPYLLPGDRKVKSWSEKLEKYCAA